MDAIAVRPIRAYKKVIMTLNGVTKNVVVPVPSRTSDAGQKNQSENDVDDSEDDECVITDDSECVITDVVTSAPAASSESSCQLLLERSNPDLVDLDMETIEVEPVQIIPSNDQQPYDMVDLTLTTEKRVDSGIISHSPHNRVPAVYSANTASSMSTIPTGIVAPITLHSSSSASTGNSATLVVSMEAQPSAFPAATIFRSVVESNVDSVPPSETLVAPVVIAPQPGTDVSAVSAISLPRTMTKEEAVAVGWYTDENRADHLLPQGTTTTTQPNETCYAASMLLRTLPEMRSFSAEPVVRNDFVSSAELVSLENVDVDMNDNPANLALGVNNHLEIVPLLSDGDGSTSSFIGSENRVNQQHELDIDVTVDEIPQPLAKVTNPRYKFENISDYFDDEDDCKYGTLMSDEDEPLTAVVEGMVNDNLVCGTDSNSEQTNIITKTKNMAKRIGGRPRMAAERHCLKNCEVWLQQLRLPSATVKVRAVWRYLCCRNVVLPATPTCSLCAKNQNSDNFFELEVARRFRAGSQVCKRASKEWCEFSIDSSLLPVPATMDASQSEKSPVNKSPLRVTQSSDHDSDASSQGNKKYLLIKTGTGTFVVPVDSAVGCIVSEHEITKMLHLQSVQPLSSYAGEFSKDALLAACSQLKPSQSHDSASTSDKPEPLSPKAQKTSASAAKNADIRQRKPDDFRHNSLSPRPLKTPVKNGAAKRISGSSPKQLKTRVKNFGAAKHISGKKCASNRLLHNAHQRFALKRELRSLGLLTASPRRKKS